MNDDKMICVTLADGGSLILVAEPKACGCGRVAALMVNRDGRTRCVECDHDYKVNKEGAEIK